VRSRRGRPLAVVMLERADLAHHCMAVHRGGEDVSFDDEGVGHRVSVSRRCSAAGIRILAILCPLRDWASLTVGLAAPVTKDRTPTGLPRSARMRYGPVVCPLYPGD